MEKCKNESKPFFNVNFGDGGISMGKWPPNLYAVLEPQLLTTMF